MILVFTLFLKPNISLYYLVYIINKKGKLVRVPKKLRYYFYNLRHYYTMRIITLSILLNVKSINDNNVSLLRPPHS